MEARAHAALARMNRPSDRRSAVRVRVRIPATVEVLGDPHEQPGFDAGYERLVVPGDMAGARFDATICDLSINGARLSASKLPPQLSRISLSFSLPGYERVLAVCMVMWRRTTPEAGTPGSEDSPGEPGFGVSFEAVDVGVRKCIADLVSRSPEGA
jgi:hypothetical protein